jgi:Tol biopolymer transport system component/imidazolonepropionase-like amidohydrolase
VDERGCLARWQDGVFDLLGDLHTVPITGGAAKRILGDRAWDYQPRFSPDGTKILFTSDRGGTDNIWIAKADGSDPEKFTGEKDKVTNCGAWSPDGDYIVAKRRLTDHSSIGTTELWLYHRTGGSGLQVTKKDDLAEVSEPTFHPGGRFIDFSARPSRFAYDRDANKGIYQIRRFDRQTGQVTQVTSRFGGGGRPTISPDGKLLAYVSREGLATILVVQDLESGAERKVTEGLTHDLQESFAWAGVHPGFDWMSDGKSVVISAKGKLWKVEVAGGGWTPIPFTTTVELEVEEALRFKPDVTGETLRLRILRWIHQPTLEGPIVFSAIGRLYATGPDGSHPHLLLEDDDGSFEYAPRFSPDGKWLAYVTWSDADEGHVWKVKIGAGGVAAGKPVRLTSVPGQYVNPSWSRDGKRIVYLRGSGVTLRGGDLGDELWHEIYVVGADGGTRLYVVSVNSRGSARRMPAPVFDQSSERVFYLEDSSEKESKFVSVKLDGTDKREHLVIPCGEEVAVSPDGKWVAYKHLHDGYVAPFPFAGKEPVNVSDSDGGLVAKRLTKEGADWLCWLDARTVTWGAGPTFYRQTLEQIFAKPPKDDEKKDGQKKEGGEGAGEQKDGNNPDGEQKDAGASAAPPDTSKGQPKDRVKAAPKPDPNAPQEIEIRLRVPRAKPTGTLVLDGARLVTMRGDEVIETGCVVIEDNRIKAVGRGGDIPIPAGAKVIDASGMTAMPGMCDVHSHMGYGEMDIFPQKEWRYYANLAYGVTTTMDPSASTHLALGQSEMVEAGVAKGPRVYSTGFTMYGADQPGKAPTNSKEDAEHHVRRMKRLGAFAVKSYMQPRREQRQWYIEAARAESMLVFPEGGGNFEMNMSMIVDGHTGIEHAVPVTPLYNDVIQMWSQTHVGYTLTLLVAYGGLSGEHWFYQHAQPPVWQDEKLLRFTPRAVIDSRSRRLPLMAYDGDWHHIEVAQSAKKFLDAGGSVQLGAHGQLQGLGAHWELWSIGQGGISNHEALRCATQRGAWYTGLGDELGSLEPGKLADVIVMAKNPLDDLHNSTTLVYVVKNGELFDANTLDELYPVAVHRPDFFWR